MLLISVIVSMLHELIALNYYPWWLEFNNFEKKKFNNLMEMISTTCVFK